MFCSKCGAENPEGAKFCSKCGAELGVATEPTEGAAKPEAESSTGMSANVAGLLCYVGGVIPPIPLGWISGLVFLAIEKKSTFVKFHAWQAIIVFGALAVLNLIFFPLHFIPYVGLGFWILSVIVMVASVVLAIILMLLAYQGKMWKVPWAGDWAEKQANK
jgi:uncharacterized membrane protein